MAAATHSLRPENPETACPDCGAPDAAEECEFCARFDGMLEEKPRAGNVIEFWEGVLHT